MNNRNLFLEQALAQYIQTKNFYEAANLFSTMQIISKDSFSQLVTDDNNKTFLALALENNAAAIFEQLWDTQQDNLEILLHKNDRQQTLLDTAIFHASFEYFSKIISALEKHDRMDVIFFSDENANTALHHAMMLEHPNKDEIVNLLIARANKHLHKSLHNNIKEFVNQDNANGETPLYLGFKYYSTDCLNQLIDYGADFDCLNHKNETIPALFFSFPAEKQTTIINSLNKNNQIYFLMLCKDFYLNLEKTQPEKAAGIKEFLPFLAKLNSMKFYTFMDNLLNHTIENGIRRLNALSGDLPRDLPDNSAIDELDNSPIELERDPTPSLSATIQANLDMIESEIILLTDKIELRKYFYITDIQEQIKIYQNLDDHNKIYYLKHYIDFLNEKSRENRNHSQINHLQINNEIIYKNILSLADLPINIKITLAAYAKNCLDCQTNKERDQAHETISHIIDLVIKNKANAMHAYVDNVLGFGKTANTLALAQNKITLNNINHDFETYITSLDDKLNHADSAWFSQANALRLSIVVLTLTLYIALETYFAKEAVYYNSIIRGSGRHNRTAEKIYGNADLGFTLLSVIFGVVGAAASLIFVFLGLVTKSRDLTLSSRHDWAAHLDESKQLISEFNQNQASEDKQMYADNIKRLEDEITNLQPSMLTLFKQSSTVKNNFTNLNTEIKNIRTRLYASNKPITNNSLVPLLFSQNHNSKTQHNNDKNNNINSDVVIEMNSLDTDSQDGFSFEDEKKVLLDLDETQANSAPTLRINSI
jgi:hypothetical protein